MKKQKQRRRKKKQKKTAKAKARRLKVKVHKGPFQIELPLQMPLFPLTSSTAPSSSS